MEPIRLSDNEGTERSAKVKTWLREERYFEKEQESPDNLAVFQCKLDSGIPFTVILPLRQSVVFIATNIEFPPKDEKALNNLIDSDEGDDFILSLRFTSLYIGCGEKLMAKDDMDFEKSKHLAKIRFFTGVHNDGLSKETLMRAIDRLDRTLLATRLILEKYSITVRPRAESQLYR